MAGRRTPGGRLDPRLPRGRRDAALRALEDDPYIAAGVVAYDAVGMFTPGAHAPALAAALTAG